MMRRVSLAVGLLILLSTWVVLSQDTLVVRLSLSNGGDIQVAPDPLEIKQGDQVRWEITGPRRDQVEIEFVDAQGTRGPFPSRGGSENPSRGRFRRRAGGSVTSGRADRTGEFKYSVVWSTGDGRMIRLDPVIVVR